MIDVKNILIGGRNQFTEEDNSKQNYIELSIDKIRKDCYYYIRLDNNIEDIHTLEFSEYSNEKLSCQVKGILCTYPFSKEVFIPLKDCKTIKDLVIDSVDAYNYIYKLEELTSNIQEHLLKDEGKQPSLNRCQTDGIIGIWGHVIGDLVLHTITIDDNGIVYLGIDS